MNADDALQAIKDAKAAGNKKEAARIYREQLIGTYREEIAIVRHIVECKKAAREILKQP